MNTTPPIFRGLIPAVVLPFTADLNIDEPALRRYARWLLSHDGLAGVAVNVDTGEGPSLSPAERRRVIEIWAEETKGEVPVVAGIGGPTTAEAAIGARDAREAGASALLVFPIPAYNTQLLAPEVPYAYHRAVEDAAGLPLVLFQLQPALGGVIFDDACWEALLSIESVCAAKEASFDRNEFLRAKTLISHAPHNVTLLTGNDNFICESFVLGAEGALIGFGTLAVPEQTGMIRAALSEDWGTVNRANKVIGPLADAIFAEPVGDYRARTKYALRLMGVIDNGIVRPPLKPLSTEATEMVRAAMESAGQLEQ